MRISKLFMLLLFLSQFFFATVSYADNDVENANLARIRNILSSLTPLINEAENQRDKNDRVLFRYDWLRADIESIKQGINEKLKPISIEPRHIVPLKGDYLVQQGKQK